MLPIGLRLLARASAVPILGRGLTWFVDARWPGMRSSIIARTRLIDDWMLEATRGGAERVVLLGAGFDSRAWRLPFLAHIRVFEVDHPNTSAAKQRRLSIWGVDLRHVRFVQVDFDRQTIADRLAEAGFDYSQRAIGVWDGVTNYLQPEAVDTITRWVGGLANGGEFVFTYVHSGVLDGTVSFDGAARVMRAVQKSGEPWTFGMRPDTVAEYLSRRGMRLLSDLSAAEYRHKVMGPAAQRLHGYEFYHVVGANIVGA